MAAYCTVAQGAPPPKWMRLKWVSSSIPSPRMISLSGLVSIVNVDSPSTWLGSTPASVHAARAAPHPRVCARRDGRFQCELQLAAPGVLGELRRPDPDDGRSAGVR